MAVLETGPIIVILIVVLLLFGAAAIPKLARALGKAKGEFQKGKSEFDREVKVGEASAGAAGTRTPPASEAEVRQTARNLGIVEEGKPIAEVKRLINEKVGF